VSYQLHQMAAPSHPASKQSKTMHKYPFGYSGRFSVWRFGYSDKGVQALRTRLTPEGGYE